MVLETDKTILVPLTNSLYIPGKLCDLENVIVDVGTGYYVQKVSAIIQCTPQASHMFPCSQSRPQALKHYQSKVDYIRTNLEALQETIQKKQDNMNYLINVMQMKLQEQAPSKNAKA